MRCCKMIRLLLIFLNIAFVLAKEESAEPSIYTENIETKIQAIEQLTAKAEKSRRDGTLPSDTTQIYDKIAIAFGDLITHIDNENNTLIFFNLKGVNRVIIQHIRATYIPIRTQLLYLIKKLFKNDLTTTNKQLPINIVDMLLDVFENDDNLALKAHSLDVLYLWLPKNPRLQARVMKLKGLQPFYEQIAKLDSTVIYKLLDLFNIILEEHLKARSNKELKHNDKFYQMIGLVERMSTPTVCNGLLNIFKEVITYSENSYDIFEPVVRLLKNIKPFCLNLYKGKNTAMEVFKQLLDYFKDSESIRKFENTKLNVTDIVLLLSEYNEKLREHFKDEF